MSWSIEEHIGDCRPFPAQVVVYRGETDECLAYVSGEVADRLKAENDKLRVLCATVIDDWMSKVCPTFPFCEYGGEYQDCTDETCGNQIYRQMARELGVEVDA